MAIISALPETTTYLRRLESGLVIPATTGTRTFYTQSTMFPGFFDSKFSKLGTNVPTIATGPASSALYEITRAKGYRDLLGSFKTSLELLLWKSQDQILTWIESYPQHIHPSGYPTYFPFTVFGKFFVVVVDIHNNKLGVNLDHFHSDQFMDIGCLDRMVLPE